jgi:phage gpG-like protein
MDTATVQGLGNVERRLDTVAEAASDISPTFRELGDKFAARQDTVFDTNGWGKWAPRAPSTIAEGVSPLVQTGIMRDGLSGDSTIWRGKNAAAFGGRRADRRVFNIAVFHAYGTARMPARLPVPTLRAAEKREWIDVVRDHMREAIR